MGLKPCAINVLMQTDPASAPYWKRIEAWRVNEYFAVHRPACAGDFALQGRWRVTHIPTGYLMAASDSRDLAVRIARRLAAVRGINWASTEVNLILDAPLKARDAARAAAYLPPMKKGTRA